eukprot:4737346-Alexandrium_andersonii.AAC.1
MAFHFRLEASSDSELPGLQHHSSKRGPREHTAALISAACLTKSVAPAISTTSRVEMPWP